MVRGLSAGRKSEMKKAIAKLAKILRAVKKWLRGPVCPLCGDNLNSCGWCISCVVGRMCELKTKAKRSQW